MNDKALRQAMKIIGARGGSANTPAQKAARAKNAEKARQARDANRKPLPKPTA